MYSGIVLFVKDAYDMNLASIITSEALKFSSLVYKITPLFFLLKGFNFLVSSWVYWELDFSLIRFSITGKASLFLSVYFVVFYSVPWRSWLTWFYPDWHHSCRKKPVYLTVAHTRTHTVPMGCHTTFNSVILTMKSNGDVMYPTNTWAHPGL